MRAGDRAQREGEYFDRQAREQGEFNPFAERGWLTLRRRFEREIAAPPAARLLDIGCGTGHSRKIYERRAARYVGLDLSLSSVILAKSSAPGAGWLVADGTALPARGETFDVVAFSSVLHHMEHPEAALRGARGALRPGGWAFAFDPNLWHPAMALFRHPRSPFYSARGVSPDERPLRPRTVRRLFAAAGFERVGQTAQSGIAYRHVAPPVLNALLGAYNLVDGLWQAVGLGRWFGTFVVTWGQRPASGS